MPNVEFYGKDESEVIRLIEDGHMLASIAASCGVNRSMLTRWIASDEKRSARAREARRLAADAWTELAETGIREAADPFELAKAKEMAHHYRWKASKVAPKEFGDKLELAGNAESPLTVVVKKLTDEQLEARVKALQNKLET